MPRVRINPKTITRTPITITRTPKTITTTPKTITRTPKTITTTPKTITSTPKTITTTPKEPSGGQHPLVSIMNAAASDIRQLFAQTPLNLSTQQAVGKITKAINAIKHSMVQSQMRSLLLPVIIPKGLTHVQVRDPGFEGLDAVVWSISRPDMLERVLASYQKHFKYDKIKIRWHLWMDYYPKDKVPPHKGHDAFDKHASDRCVAMARKFGFDTITQRQCVGKGSQGQAMSDGLDAVVKGRYLLHLDEDHALVRDIDLDLAYQCMEQNRWINQLNFFNRWVYHTRVQRKAYIDDKPYPLTGAGHWYFNGPAIWRMSFLRPRWLVIADNIHNKLDDHRQPGSLKPPNWRNYVDPLGPEYPSEKEYAQMLPEYKKLSPDQQKTHARIPFTKPHIWSPERQLHNNYCADVLGCFCWGNPSDKSFSEHLGHDLSIWHIREGGDGNKSNP